MNQAVTAPTVDRRPREDLPGRLARWEIVFLLLFAGSILGAVWWQSSRTFFWGDEFFTALLCSDPSFSSMMHTIAQGGEVNPPVFFILEWGIARLFGSGELALRAVSGLSVAMAGWLLFLTTRRLVRPPLAALAMVMVFGLSRQIFIHMTSARYYGLFVFLVACTVFQAMRLPLKDRIRFRDCGFVFLVHSALANLHLYGLFYSGSIFVAMGAIGWTQRKWDWRLYLSIVAAWATFLGWVPSLLNQLKAMEGGTWTPHFPMGIFLADLTYETPLALILMVVVFLGALSRLSPHRASTGGELAGSSAETSWLSAVFAALALFAVPAATWLGSHLGKPFYMNRYSLPSIIALILFVACVLAALDRLPQIALRSANPPAALWNLVWVLVLGFCLCFQFGRALKAPPKPAAPFVDHDFGYEKLPMVFENCTEWMPRAFYGHNRSYVMLIDRDAAAADSGYFTKLMAGIFGAWRAHRTDIAYYADLPEWPDGFLAVDDDLTKTFEWIFAHRPELKTQLLGTIDPADDFEKVYGQKRVYLVRRTNLRKPGLVP